jgi:hypothetical protein
VIGVRPAEIELLLAPRGLVVKADVAARDPILGRLHVVRDAHAPGYYVAELPEQAVLRTTDVDELHGNRASEPLERYRAQLPLGVGPEHRASVAGVLPYEER